MSVSAAFTPFRTSGVAPLGVTVDATATTSTRTTKPWRDIHYKWAVDSDLGQWRDIGQANLNKNAAIGVVNGFVFENPGTYTITLTAWDGVDWAIATATITVDEWVEGTHGNIVCFSNDTDHTGAPAGADLVSNVSDLDNIVNTRVGTHKMFLFHAGHSFTSSTSVQTPSSGPWYYGKYGTGADPIWEGHNGNIFTPTSGDGRIVDIEIDGNSGAASVCLTPGSVDFNNLLLLRCYLHHWQKGLLFTDDALGASDTLWSNIVVADCDIITSVGSSGGYGAYMACLKSAFIGNVWDNSQLGEHCFRSPGMQTTYIGHSLFQNCNANKNLLTLRAPPWGGSFPVWGANKYTEYCVVADNKFIGSVESWMTHNGPQNNDAGTDERARRNIWERNFYDFGASSQIGFICMGSEITFRHNTGNLSGGIDNSMVTLLGWGDGPDPTDCDVEHNSTYSGDSIAGTAFYTINSGCNSNRFRNNLGYAPNWTGSALISDAGTSNTKTNNTGNSGSLTTSPAFTTSPPTARSHFNIQTSSYAKNNGTDVRSFWSAGEIYIPQGANPDIGAFEFDEGGLPPWGSTIVAHAMHAHRMRAQ